MPTVKQVKRLLQVLEDRGFGDEEVYAGQDHMIYVAKSADPDKNPGLQAQVEQAGLFSISFTSEAEAEDDDLGGWTFYAA